MTFTKARRAKFIDTSTDPNVASFINGLAERIGEDASSIRAIDPRMAEALQDGVVIDLYIGGATGFSKLTFDDLGIVIPEDPEQRRALSLIQLGSRRQLPERIMIERARRESAGRSWLNHPDNSFPSHWGRFVPSRRYPAWRDRNLKLQAEYHALRDDIRENWSDYMAEVRKDCVLLAVQAYHRLTASRIVIRGDVQTWANERADRMMGQIPTRDEYCDSLVYKWDIDGIPVNEALASAEQRTQLIQAEADRLVSDELVRARVEMERDRLARAQQQWDERITKFVDEVQTSINHRIFLCMVDVLGVIKKRDGAALPGASVRELRQLVSGVRGLNFFNDAQLEQQMAEIDRMMSSSLDSRKGDALTPLLTQIAAETKMRLIQLGGPTERVGRDSGLPSDLPQLAAMARQPRRDADNPPATISTSSLPDRQRGRERVPLSV